eukprot:TRINITY_DN185_c0_g1_i1.p1 TRINITY_DN185_c0_g1~~TRINITY_DN185_c0_g1_i1.p1  ORF type:complete len:256 (+),score=44.06 TRINITY_DN185_c0_g1_i1:436-1203(+)
MAAELRDFISLVMARQRDPLRTEDPEVVESPRLEKMMDSKISDGETAVSTGTDCDSAGNGCVRREAEKLSSSSITDVLVGSSNPSERWKPEFTHDRNAPFQEWQHQSQHVERPRSSLMMSSRTHSEMLESDSVNQAHHNLQAEASAGDEVASTSRIDTCPGSSPELDDLAFNHKMAERKRRKKHKDSLQMLRALLPNIKKKDKTSVLGHTVDYLKQLTAERHQLLERKRDLQAVIEKQDRELIRLQSSTQDNSRR